MVHTSSRHSASANQPGAWRWCLALVGTAASYYALLAAWPRLALFWGLGTGDGWFLDLHALLAAGEAARLGIPVYENNPLDIYHRPHSYSSWWLVMGDLGLTRADAPWLGVVAIGLFLVAAVAGLRPSCRREWAWGLGVLASPAVLLCVVRANNDLVVFLVLAALVPVLVSPRPLMRWVGAGLVALGTGLKYYPLAAGLLLLAEPDRRLQLWRHVLFAVMLVLVLLGVYEDTLHFSRTLPAPDGLFSFGARLGLGLWGVPPIVTAGIFLALLGWGAVSAWRRRGAGPAAEADAAELAFVLGAVLLAGCYWMGSNWAYRWIFALWLLPALWRAPECSRLGRFEAGLMLVLLPVCLWWDGFCSMLWNLGPGQALGWPLDVYSRRLWTLVQPVHLAVCGMLTVACVRFAVRHLLRTWWPGRARS